MILLVTGNPWQNIPFSSDLALMAPMLALVVTMLAVVLCPVVLGRGPRQIATLALVGVVAMILLAARTMGHLPENGQSLLAATDASGLLIVDRLSLWFQIILGVFIAAVTWMWWMGSAAREENAPEFFILLLGSALGMAAMVSSTNLLMIIIAIEMASLPSYALVGFNKRDGVGAEASLKYMVFGAICAAIMLYGASMLYGLTKSLDLHTIAVFTFEKLASNDVPILLPVALLCFFVGIAFKLSAVPFHFWCPDAFQGARIEVTTWLSVVSKAAGVLLLARIVMILASTASSAQGLVTWLPLAWFLAVVAMITATVGNFAAYRQTSVKRLLAYSSIAHAGYMMMAASVFLYPRPDAPQAGLSALVVYIMIYLFMNLGAFGVTAIVSWQTGSDDIDAFTGLIRRAPALAVPMVFCLVSLVGIPPFAGFLAKWWVLIALGKTGGLLSSVVITVLVLNTLFSLYYYMRIVVKMVLDDRPEARPVGSPIGGLIMVNFCAVMLLALFFFAQPAKDAADRFTSDLYRPGKTKQPQPAGDSTGALAMAQGSESR